MKILRFINRVVFLSVGFALSIFFALTLHSLSIIVLSNSGVYKDNGFFELVLLVFLLIWLILFFVFWLKIKSVKIKLLAIFCLTILYIFGRSYAVKSASPYFRVMKIVNKADAVQSKEFLSAMDSNDSKKIIEAEKKHADSYKEALEVDLKSMPRTKDYIEKKYNVIKEVLEYDEKVLSGLLKPTKEEADKKIEEFKRKLNIANIGAINRPFWMDFFFVI